MLCLFRFLYATDATKSDYFVLYHLACHLISYPGEEHLLMKSWDGNRLSGSFNPRSSKAYGGYDGTPCPSTAFGREGTDPS